MIGRTILTLRVAVQSARHPDRGPGSASLTTAYASGPCIIWSGRRDRQGYGRFNRALAHRLAYESAVGSIPPGYHVDHICFVPACVNPEHLRVLTAEENTRLQRSSLATHCRNGHEYTPENTYIRPRRYREGTRDCRVCIRARVRKYQARLRASA